MQNRQGRSRCSVYCKGFSGDVGATDHHRKDIVKRKLPSFCAAGCVSPARINAAKQTDQKTSPFASTPWHDEQEFVSSEVDGSNTADCAFAHAVWESVGI
jgi:hypothetical protein